MIKKFLPMLFDPFKCTVNISPQGILYTYHILINFHQELHFVYFSLGQNEERQTWVSGGYIQFDNNPS